MKKFGKIAAAVLIIITAAAVLFTGCSTSLGEEEGRKLLADGISDALASDTYYIKYRLNDTSSDDGKYVQYSLNVQGGTAKFTTATGTLLKTVYDDVYYGASLRNGIDKKSAASSDYVTGKVYRGDSGEWEVKECSLDEFLTDEKISGYNMDSVTALLSGLTREELRISSVTKTGKVVYISAQVVKEDNVLSKYSSLTIRIINGKLAYIGDANESFNVSISYGGPAINIPAWTQAENKGEQL